MGKEPKRRPPQVGMDRFNEKIREEMPAEVRAIEAAAQQAVRQALLAHKRAGNPVAAWRDEQVVWIPAEEIPVEDDREG
jgi:hypothetical protein